MSHSSSALSSRRLVLSLIVSSFGLHLGDNGFEPYGAPRPGLETFLTALAQTVYKFRRNYFRAHGNFEEENKVVEPSINIINYSIGFDSRRYQILGVVVGLERGPLSLVRSIEELLE